VAVRATGRGKTFSVNLKKNVVQCFDAGKKGGPGP
jgi:hypothetical protein